MKRDPEDWGVEDIDFAIARPHGYTLQQVMSLDFPRADYIGEAGGGSRRGSRRVRAFPADAARHDEKGEMRC